MEGFEKPHDEHTKGPVVQIHNSEEQLNRTLKTRHLSMIAIGGTIGTGLFIASGQSISQGGPGGALLSYALIGVMVFFLMTSLGEMAAFMPVSGSFNTYGSRFVDPAFGFALGWNYWLSWSITVATELAAGEGIMQLWVSTDKCPGIVWSFLLLVLIVGFNALSVKGYGEAEFWFALIKVVTVIVFVIVGIFVSAGVLGGKVYGVSNFTIGEAPFVNGFLGVLSVFLAAGFSFQGTEMVGVAAGESANPEKDVPKAVKQVFWRILLFYICAIFVISMLIPYTDPALNGSDVTTSPFTLGFERSGFEASKHVMNAIILITVLSAGNSGMYGASRTLWMLANEGKAPRIFRKVNSNGIPIYALAFTALIACLSFLTSLFGNKVVYTWLLNASSITGFIAWLGIAVSHYRFRKAYIAQGHDISKLPYQAKWYPFGPIFALALCVVVMLGQGYTGFSSNPIDWSGIVAAYLGIFIFIILYVGYKVVKKTKVVPLLECNFSRANI
ncbi:lysine-specific permease [Basidiobolus meristosporus CBS 931.73]|uniref:Lysine-specific permease n=1 Tax=Basidiobolus meristosporus CBS 931.73 TaxID=1314790 RepID=A0A1Y1Y1S5_9FUNG|nr:lysine-specific permease [Basidiobolus meristosporus CBS 931.73]|eukprot:ORX91960.1 lysine-specific permease [Basidiobolus meristosporus CBS 931.73]